MANPRKFSEKIALHNQKQAEETAAFEQIMREVSDATSKPGGIEEIKQSVREPVHMVYRERGRSVGVGPMRSTRPIEKARIDTSPYSSGTYLSPPPDTSWRRTNSDSALHQSANNPGDSGLNHNPGSPSRRGGEHHQLMMSHSAEHNIDTGRKHLMVNPDGRPRSCCDVPRVPCISIYPSAQEPGTVQIPIGNNTGSLPDLTNFHFPSPLPTPLDLEDQSSSPYSTSPQATSPSTLSPTSLPSRPVGRFSFGSQGSGGSSQSPQGTSPGHSPGSRRRQQHQQLQNLVIGAQQQQVPQSTSHLLVPSPYPNSRYNHMCKGVAIDNSVNMLDGFSQNQQQLIYQQQQQQQQQQQNHRRSPQPPQSPQQSQQTAQCSPPLVTNSNMSSQHLNSLNTYRSPPPLCRPSPQSSPGLTVQGSPLGYRSGSPADTASHSAPQSPVSQNLSPASSPGIGSGTSPFSSDQNHYYFNHQAQTLQQHFEQFSMLDNPVSTSVGFINSQSNSVQYSQAVGQGSPEDGVTRVGSQELGPDPGYFSQSPSQLQYSSRPTPINPSGGSTQQTTPQTPNTPSSIPDIILTDFSSTGDEMSRHELVKDLGTAMAMSGSFDSDIFPSDETLRDGLEPIDFDGLQMLTDPEMNVVTDPSTEDNFRLDRL